MTRYQIAVAGAGIGGLATASLLADLGHTVTLFDQFETPRPVGSGLVVQPVGQTVLARVGALSRAEALGTPLIRMLGHETERGRPVLDVSYGATPGLALHRAALHTALLEQVQDRGIPLRTGAKVAGTEGGRLRLTTSGKVGTLPTLQTERFDLIVDALGAASPLSPLRARPLPYGAVWGTVDWPETDLPRNRLSQRYRKANRMVGVLPIGHLPGDPIAKAAIFWSLPAQGHGAWQAQGLSAWRADANALWPEFAPFSAQITDLDQLTMARYGHGTLACPWSDTLVHIGDAAHRASPQLGQGANMALLDADALARALDRHPHHLTDALRSYAMARRGHVWAYQALSAAFTPQYQSDSRWLPVLRDRILFPVSQIPPVPRILTALVTGRLLPPAASVTWDGGRGDGEAERRTTAPRALATMGRAADPTGDVDP